MKDYIQPDHLPTETKAPSTKTASEKNEIDFRDRKWRKRLAAIRRESPVRLVLAAFLIYYAFMVCVAANFIIREGHPLLDLNQARFQAPGEEKS